MHYNPSLHRFLLYMVVLASLSVACTTTKSDGEKAGNDPNNATTEKTSSEKGAVVFFGNSITAGKGVEKNEAFPALIRERIDSLEWGFEVINAGLSGETSAGGLSRVDWVLKGQNVDVFVLELGANDGLRGVEPSATYKNLDKILEKVKQQEPDAELVVAGMKVPPNMGRSYAEQFEGIFPRLAKTHDATLIPFILKGVAGNRELNQSDGIHPTAKGNEVVAEHVWEYLKPLLEKKRDVEPPA